MTASSPAQPINVFLIEDTPSESRLVRELLRDAPNDYFTTINASTLAEGLERLAADNGDVILLDLDLPDSTLLCVVV
ncbi:MAG: hypothetical protein ACXV5E_07675 [Halobacteriota archaeon]